MYNNFMDSNEVQNSTGSQDVSTLTKLETQKDTIEKDKLSAFTPDRECDLRASNFELWLAKSKDGLNFSTDQSLSYRKLDLTDEEKSQIRISNEQQMIYREGNLAKIALDKYRLSPTPENLEEYEKARKNYLERSIPLVGIRHIRFLGDEVTIDTLPVHYQDNQVFSRSKNDQERLEAGVASGIVGNVIFAPESDGTRKMGITIRNINNSRYPGALATMVSGFFDGKLDPHSSPNSSQPLRTLLPITNESIVDKATREVKEETGLGEGFVQQSVINGLALQTDKRIHHNLLVDLNLSISASEAQKISANFTPQNPQEFSEKWVAIDYTIDNIEKLLTTVMCPFSDMQYASLVATGRNLLIDEKNSDEADKWVKSIWQKMEEHRKNFADYDPYRTPEDQGFKEPIQALLDAKLLNEADISDL